MRSYEQTKNTISCALQESSALTPPFHIKPCRNFCSGTWPLPRRAGSSPAAAASGSDPQPPAAANPHRQIQPRKWGKIFKHAKLQPSPSVFNILTSKCASRHNGVHFFDISTSKSAPTMVCFVHFHFEICFSPQRRALFRHLNFQKWSDIGVFCTFWLPNVLRATMACTFSTSQRPKVVRSSSVLSILTWKCASRHNGVQFFISHLASWLRTRRFREPTFRPSGATNHWKNTVNRDFPIFSRIYLFFLLIFLFSLPLPCSAFQLSILSEV